MFAIFCLAVGAIYAVFILGLMTWASFAMLLRGASRASDAVDKKTSVLTNFHALLNRHYKSFVVGSLLMSLGITVYQVYFKIEDNRLVCESKISCEQPIKSITLSTTELSEDFQTFNDYSFSQVDKYAEPQSDLIQAIRQKAQHPNYHLDLYQNYTWKAELLIEQNGKVKDIRIYKGISKGLDTQIMDIIQKHSLWKPAYKDGQAVNQRLLFSVDLK
ncbi:MAG: energy transducer TonB [Bernardetiaceae bacterium]|nr:energy transducer TonB [Bernardetiaceae bacterium]